MSTTTLSSIIQPSDTATLSPITPRGDTFAAPIRNSHVSSDDDDEIVWPMSSQSSPSSTSPAAEGRHDRIPDPSMTPPAVSFRNDINEKLNDNSINKHDTRDVVGQRLGDHFLDDFVLERGDCGSKVWTPPPSTQRSRKRGHRSTRSESAIPAPQLVEPNTAQQRVEGSWADDVDDLEKQLKRTVLTEPPVRPRSTPSSAQPPQKQSLTPRKQRSPRKQKDLPRQANKSASATTPKPLDTITAAHSYPSPAASPTSNKISPTEISTPSKTRSPGRKKSKQGKGRNYTKKDAPAHYTLPTAPSTAPSTPRGLGTRSIVDDVSEYGDAFLPPLTVSVRQSETGHLLDVAYDEAVKFMNAFIENPDYYTSRASRLTFLQALIVELGLVSATGPERTLPGSLTAAKALLKSHAFLNVKDYLSLREQGLDALRNAMRPSRGALVRDLRGRSGRRAKLGWIKETGLSVLLVSCQH
ncbi:uncharacterized protein FOMMEDRAFT_139285 [Fomitiporia mediterranea MF3/22]|uniref:uncharacterized protein n=1 Tax=Fomitiporia mediterranea (strain MF3/22) TaxID=694068 RepID=UPI0004408B44|nr:uncharacterized protein FOMMEDRAFT_139285 [Fomitiporia mediterranea MF3/22]EJD05987.1 hypothetical protein FOMMEDRAFT_139285 [Fomitiporia mediterranea MF3/22]